MCVLKLVVRMSNFFAALLKFFIYYCDGSTIFFKSVSAKFLDILTNNKFCSFRVQTSDLTENSFTYHYCENL